MKNEWNRNRNRKRENGETTIPVENGGARVLDEESDTKLNCGMRYYNIYGYFNIFRRFTLIICCVVRLQSKARLLVQAPSFTEAFIGYCLWA